MRRLVIIMVFLCLIVTTPSPTRALPSNATQTSLISIEFYWAVTAGGAGDFPDENEWNVLYEGQNITFDFRYSFINFKMNVSTILAFHSWVEVSVVIGSFAFNGSGYNTNSGGLGTDSFDDIDNLITLTACINTTEGEYFYNRRTFTFNFPVTSTTATDNNPILNTTLPLLAGIGIVAAIAATAIVISRKRTPTISLDARVLIVCPYCGAKNEQGILKCQKCLADL